jgi:hypothetical protein
LAKITFKGRLLMLGEAEAYFSEVRNRPNTYISGALMNPWILTESARKIRTHSDFPQFAEDIGLVRCWQIHRWPPQVQLKPGTDGSNLQFSCRQENAGREVMEFARIPRRAPCEPQIFR